LQPPKSERGVDRKSSAIIERMYPFPRSRDRNREAAADATRHHSERRMKKASGIFWSREAFSGVGGVRDRK
jgi:hypothetical protein